jgi:hypothetical protein
MQLIFIRFLAIGQQYRTYALDQAFSDPGPIFLASSAVSTGYSVMLVSTETR